MTDPTERIVAEALKHRGISFKREREGGNTLHLDFFLPGYNTYIECKQFHSPRIAEQMSRHPYVIAIQGQRAAKAFAHMLRNEEGLRAKMEALPVDERIERLQEVIRQQGVSMAQMAKGIIPEFMRASISSPYGNNNSMMLTFDDPDTAVGAFHRLLSMHGKTP